MLDDAVIWGFTGGPQVAPGVYSVRLTTGEWSATRTFEVLPDPRSEIAQDERDAQYALMLQIRRSLQEAHEAIDRIRELRVQLVDRAERAAEAGFGDDLPAMADSITERLGDIERELTQTRSESNQDPLNFPPKLDNQLAYLYGYVGSSDGPPTAGAERRFSDLRAELDLHLAELEAVIEDGVAYFNEILRQREVPGVVVPEVSGSPD